MFNVGIIGSGLQATRRVPAINNNKNTMIKIMAGVNKTSLEGFQKQYGFQVTENWREVVEDPSIDIIVICTPPYLHYEIMYLAIQKNKHILCEKPFTLSSQDAKKIDNLVKNKKITVKCGFNHRYHPGIMKAYELIKSDKIGTPFLGRAVYGICGRDNYKDEWRADTNCVSGGQLMEQGVHIIDLFRWIFGEFESVSADVATHVFDIYPLEDTAAVVLHGKGGVSATLATGITQWRNKFHFEVYGEKGYVEVEGLGGSYGVHRIKIGERRPNDPFTETVIEYRGSDKTWEQEWNYFMDAIKLGKLEWGTIEDGAIANYIVEQAYRASNEKARVELIYK